MRRRFLFAFAVAVVTGLAADQAINLMLLQDGRLRGRAVAPFDPPLFNAGQRASLERWRALAEAPAPPQESHVRFDPDLGWCAAPASAGALYSYDARGARVAGAAAPGPAGTRPLLAVVGDSFTHGDEVTAEESWPALLGGAVAGIEVANFGVSAHGLDQTLLRYRRDLRPLAPRAVWLGLVPAALPRLLSIYRPAMQHAEEAVVFKPRLLLDPGEAGGLGLVAHPARSPADVPRLVLDPAAFAAATRHDLFVQAVPAAYARHGTSILHFFASTRLWLTWAEGRRRFAADWFAPGDDRLRALATAVILAFAGEVRQGGGSFRVVILPDGRSLRHRLSHAGRWYIAPLLEDLAAAGVAVTDLAPAFDAAGLRHDAEWFRPLGHYAPRLNAVVAAALAPLARAVAEDAAHDGGGPR